MGCGGVAVVAYVNGVSHFWI